MCGGGSRPAPPPVPVAQATPAAIAGIYDTAPTLDIESNSKMLNKKKKGKKAFKQKTSIATLGSPSSGSGLSIPKSSSSA
jgi:hypothetical protein